MAHKMGLLVIDMTTGKQVAKTLTLTYDTSSRTTNATCASSTSGGTVTIYPCREFNTASGYTSTLLNASTANTDCYYLRPCSSTVASSNIKLGCASTARTEYWSDVNVGGGLYSGQYVKTVIQSDRNSANIVANFTYSGTPLTFTIPWYGNYTLTVYGAQGGSVNSTLAGGRGAIVSGKLDLNKNAALYVYVGAQGNTTGADAWNGGGHMHQPTHSDNNKWIKAGSVSCGGGGATDIALQNAGTGNWKTNAHLYSRIIVAGGGGGAFNWTGETGSAAGGNGYGNATNSWYGCAGAGADDPGGGGTLSAGGKAPTYYLATSPGATGSYTAPGFGYGGSMDMYHNTTWEYEAAGGGGGGWYGGSFGGYGSRNGAGGGGSSYAWTTTSSLNTYYPSSEYKPSTSFYLSNVSLSTTGNTGAGRATIVCTTVN